MKSLLVLMICNLVVASIGFAKQPVTKKKRIVYRKHTSLDFSAQEVQGQVRAPDIFYIFQRKKSHGHEIVKAPRSLNHHSQETLVLLHKEFGG